MLSARCVYALPGLMVVAAVALSGCSDTTDCANCAPLDYESNPASAKYDFEAADTLVDDFLEDRTAVNGMTLAIVRGAEGQIYEAGYGDLDRNRISRMYERAKRANREGGCP